MWSDVIASSSGAAKSSVKRAKRSLISTSATRLYET